MRLLFVIRYGILGICDESMSGFTTDCAREIITQERILISCVNRLITSFNKDALKAGISQLFLLFSEEIGFYSDREKGIIMLTLFRRLLLWVIQLQLLVLQVP